MSDPSAIGTAPLERLRELAQEFLDLYKAHAIHFSLACGWCGRLPHADNCLAARFDEVLRSAEPPSPAEQEVRLEIERDEARRQRDALLEAIKPMRFAPATSHERRLMEIAEAAIKSAEGGVDITATNCPRCHGTGKKADSLPPASRGGTPQRICMSCDGCGWCEGSPAFTCSDCKGFGRRPSPQGGSVIYGD